MHCLWTMRRITLLILVAVRMEKFKCLMLSILYVNCIVNVFFTVYMMGFVDDGIRIS